VAVPGWTNEYAAVRSGPFRGLFKFAELGPVQIAYEWVDQPFEYRGTAWPNSHIFLSYLPGADGALYDNRQVNPVELVSSRWDDVERVSCNRKAELVTLVVDGDYLAQYVSRLPGMETFAHSRSLVRYVADARSILGFQNTVFSVIEDLLEDRTLLDNARACEGLRARVLDSLLEAISNCGAKQVRLPAPSTRAYIVDRAIEYIEPRLGDPISVSDICAVMRVCPRTLSYAFASVLGTTLKSYLLASRLRRVHRDLEQGSPAISVQSIASRWGLYHMGRFARSYRSVYGERPSDTFRRGTEILRRRAAPTPKKTLASEAA